MGAVRSYLDGTGRTDLLIDRPGRHAHDHMIRANLRLVVSIARRFQGRGLDLETAVDATDNGAD